MEQDEDDLRVGIGRHGEFRNRLSAYPVFLR